MYPKLWELPGAIPLAESHAGSWKPVEYTSKSQIEKREYEGMSKYTLNRVCDPTLSISTLHMA